MWQWEQGAGISLYATKVKSPLSLTHPDTEPHFSSWSYSSENCGNDRWVKFLHWSKAFSGILVKKLLIREAIIGSGYPLHPSGHLGSLCGCSIILRKNKQLCRHCADYKLQLILLLLWYEEMPYCHKTTEKGGTAHFFAVFVLISRIQSLPYQISVLCPLG